MSKWGTDTPPAQPQKRPCVPLDDLTPTGPTAPTQSINPPDIVDQLRIIRTNETRTNGDYWIIGAHGWAGESTIAAMDPHAKASGHSWPVNPSGQHVAVVARETKGGIRAAQHAAKHWDSGTLPGVTMLALITIPAHPGKLNKDLKDYLDRVAGGYPIHLRLDWHLDYQHHLDPRDAKRSRSMAKLARNLRYLSTHQKKGNTP